MWKKNDEGGFKPLWVKCGCGKWNAVQVGAVVKYLEKTVTPKAEEPRKKETSDAGDHRDEHAV